jgi:hypothetical protein
MKYIVSILLTDGSQLSGEREYTGSAKIEEYQDIEARGYFIGYAEQALGKHRIKRVEVHRTNSNQPDSRVVNINPSMQKPASGPGKYRSGDPGNQYPQPWKPKK